jgi:transcriptional regulator with XRE-family HTH domain
MKKAEKEIARNLRKQGLSMNQIMVKIGCSKSSVSLWTRDIILTESQMKGISERGRSLKSVEKRRQSRIHNEKEKRDMLISLASTNINNISKKDLKIIGTMLYWAEGRKRGQRTVSFSNSDPAMIGVIMLFFREVCLVPEDKFRGHIHIHSHLNISKSLKYWSSVTKIPPNQFYKTYCVPSISSKGKMDTLINGTLDISVCDVHLFLTIMGWIKGITNKLIKNNDD